MQLDDDARWMLKVARGDRSAFARLFDRHQLRVVRFCARFTGDTARAEELAQEVFVRLFRSASRYQPTAKFQTFLFRVATNACLNELRRPAHFAEQTEASMSEESAHALAQAPSHETPDQHVEARDVDRALQRALAKMSDRERAAFTMCRFEGMAYRDIAEALEATEAAVKSLIHRASLQVMSHLDALKAEVTTAGSAA